jgi:hypothetical protein
MTDRQLPTADLWSVYNACHVLRSYSAPYLFRTVQIRFSGAIPMLLNSRPFPLPQNRLLRNLAERGVHVREMDVWGVEESIQQEFLNLLPCLENLTTFRSVLPIQRVTPHPLLTKDGCGRPQCELSPGCHSLPDAPCTVSHHAILAHVERGLHVAKNMDGPDVLPVSAQSVALLY